MKKLIVLFCTMTLFAVLSANTTARTMYEAVSDDSIEIWTSPELFEFATNWANTFEKVTPGTKIYVSSLSKDQVKNESNSSKSIGIVTKNYLPDANSWKLIVARDVLVPVMNSENPFSDQIMKSGISPNEFSSILIKKYNWSSILNTNRQAPIKLYYAGNKTNSQFLSEFLNLDRSYFAATDVNNSDELLIKIKNDKYAVGFCRLVDIINQEDHSIIDGISLVPIDLNDNNLIDFAENIYQDLTSLERGIWIGKYPKSLNNPIYAVTNNHPVENTQVEFLSWLMTEGQDQVITSGLSSLVSSERQINIQHLYDHPVAITKSNQADQSYAIGILIILVAVFGLISIIVYYFSKSSKPAYKIESNNNTAFLTKSTVLSPDGLFFDKSHTWAFMEKEGIVRIGIADFLQHITGKISNVEMKNPGDAVQKGEPFVTLIQDGKKLTIPSPISGTIKEVNSKLNNNSSSINTSPYSEGWIYLIESVNWLTEIKSYFIGNSYKEWLTEEFTRLKDFFSSTLKMNHNNKLEMVIQDGGELNDNPLEDMGPIIWEEFQTTFINRKKA